GPGDAVRIMGHDVIAKDEARVWDAVGHDGVPGLEGGIVVDHRIDGPVEYLKESPVSAPGLSSHVDEEVILDQNSLRLLARPGVVSAGDVHRGPGVADDVIGDRHV